MRDQNTDLLKILQESQKQMAVLQEQNQQYLLLINQLRAQIEKLQHLIFGQKSERRKNIKSIEPEKDKIILNQKILEKIPKESIARGRQPLPESLRREKIKYGSSDDKHFCPCCSVGKLHCVGKEITEQLDFIPAELFVKQHIRYKFACRFCQNIFVPPLPPQPIDKGLPTSGLLAEVLINKYADHLPLYRQERRFERLGYSLSRSTLCDWVSQSAFLLKPIVEAMQQIALKNSPKVHSDDTIVPILEKGKTHKGRLWVYVFGGGFSPPCVIYQYSKTRRKEVPFNFLADYQGYLQADAYAGYDGCYQSGSIIEIACFAHARRKFIEAAEIVTEKLQADLAVAIIAELYIIESRCKNMTDKQRYYYRRRYSKPILKKFYRWLMKINKISVPKSPLGQAISYALNHWKALKNYLLDGVCSINNNAVERAIKPVVLGRKNYLFSGSHLGAENAAVIYSLIETCKLLNINAYAYLKDVLQRLPTALNKNIDELFPWKWKPTA